MATRKTAPRALGDRRWEQLFESLDEGVAAFDAEGRLLTMNQAAEQLAGQSLSPAQGRHHSEVFAESPWVSELVEAVASGAQGNLGAEGTMPGLWQKPTPVRASASPILDSQAHCLGTALILQDLALQRRLETDVRRAQSLAQIGVVVAGLAHEIRNPLGGIRGAVQLLGGEVGENERAREHIDLVLREVDRLTKLLEQLLELRSRGAVESEAVNIHRILDHVLALTERAAVEGETRVVRFFDPSLPAVAGDSDALTQLFLNLVQNALQAVCAIPDASRREVRLTTRVETDYHVAPTPRGPRGQFLRMDIEDTGPGIPPEVQVNLFSPFVTTKPKGTGLGLAISHRIVADHGGTIRFESEPGRTLFRVVLPAWERRPAPPRKP